MVELYDCGEGARPRILRSASGTFPGLWQDSDGAELYALVFWLRHLDPVSCRRPTYHTDSRWVADGWNGLRDTRQPWTPH